MAEGSDQERTEEPTSRRLSEARKRGQIARSKEFNTFALTVAAAATLALLGGYAVEHLWQLMQGDFRLSRNDIFDPAAVPEHILHDAIIAAKVLVPFFGIMLLLALAAPLSIGGWNFSNEAFQPKWDKLDPIKGLGRMVSPQALVELVKALLKFLLIAGVTVWLFRRYFDRFLALNQQELQPALADSVGLIVTCLLYLCGSLALIAAIDVPFQLWNYKRQLMMTREEVRDEMRDIEGKPEVKSRIRQLQMEYARRRMMQEVPKADVVVTNPTHYAVALKYDQLNMRAPRLVAKGNDLVAAQIRKIADEAGVPLMEAPGLARAIYFSTELDQEIPAGLYLAVAQILAYVYQLKTARQFGGDRPVPPRPEDLPIPPDLRKD
ncbi:MAG: flagellar type III secretion system protein FlhB [Methylococcaceae bacterium]|nr:flagellar type III secretion system protein FlhB [Methylococcaceae bacterium]